MTELKKTKINSVGYKSWVNELKKRYKRAQIKASIAVNAELLEYYWQLEGAQGFSPVNLRYAHRFYLLYSPILQQVAEESEKEGLVESLKMTMERISC